MTKLKETLLDLLRKDERLFDEEGELKENLLRELIDQYDPQLIELLLNVETAQKKFFVPVGKVMIFKGNDFKFFIDENKLDNSYTQFENKIGLKVGSKLLREYRDVVLNFPYKDCVLEGGQSTEEGTDSYFEYNKESGDYDEKKARRKEVFFNQILAKDEIDQLFEPKAFAKVRKYQKDENGIIIESEAKEFARNEKGDIKDNLIIKGNNLLALHSLKEEFRGKVKLIYIDPPYNTGNDSFAYNDNFNHSSWLVFMKNRLEIAREFLKEDGVIFVQCDDHEQGYLKVLMDEVFSKNRYVETFIWKNTDNAPTLSKKSRKNIEFIHCFENFGNSKNPFIGKISDNDDAPLLNSGNPINELLFPVGSIKFYLENKKFHKGKVGRIEILEDFEVENHYNINPVRIKGEFKWAQLNLNEELRNGTYFLIKSEKMAIRYQKLNPSNVAPEKYLSENYLTKALGVETNEDSKKHIELLKLNFPSYPKPESLVSFLINAVTNENDIVLDYHLGSGTTAAVAHKMKRQYIGIEQMNYIESVCLERLKNVIEGEAGGISKAVSWQGGGSFIYLELAKNNKNALEKIQTAVSYEELMTFFDEMYEKYFLNYNVKIKEFKEKVSQEAGFKNLALERQKQIFGKMLDLNQLYVNRSDMEDSCFQLSENDIAATNNFYGI